MSAGGSIAIRPARPHDAAVLHGMLGELAVILNDSTKFRSTIEDIDSALSSPEPAVHALIAEQGTNAVGMAIFFLTFSTWRGAAGVYLQDIFVAPEARSTGLGKRLLCAVASWADSRGADHLRLSVDQDNTAAQEFYRGLGMRFRDDEMIFDAADAAFERLREQT